MKKYLIYAKTNTQTKNKLQQSVKMLLEDIDRGVIYQQDLECFVTHINKKVSDMNECFPRCTPIEPIYLKSWDIKDAEKKEISDFHFSLNDGQFSIHPYQLKETTKI